jgi:hypothetical protein
MALTKVKLISDGIIVQGNLHASHGITTAHIGEGSNLYYTDARARAAVSENSTQLSYNSSTGVLTYTQGDTDTVSEGSSNLYYTNARADARITNALVDEDNMASNSAVKLPSQQSVKAYVDTEVAGIVSSAPSTLDTLNELAAALGDDPNFATTTATNIGTKMPLAGGTFTGDVLAPGLYVGSANTSFDFYNNGTSYLNGAVTVDAALTQSGGAASSFSGQVNINSYLKLYTTDDQAHKWYLYTHTDDSFRMNYDGSGGDEITMDTSGNITFAGNIALGGGSNLAYHSGQTSTLALDDQASLFSRANETYLSQNFFYNNGNSGNGSAIEAGKSTVMRLARGEFNLYFSAASVSAGATTSLQEKFKITDTGNATFAGDVTLTGATALDFQVADFAQIKFRESGAIMIDSDNNQSSRNFAIKDGDGTNLLLITDTGNSTFAGNITLGDGKKLQFGAGPDFEIWHAAGENTYLVESGEGATVFKSTDWYFQDTSSNTALHLSAAGNATFAGTVTATGGNISSSVSGGDSFVISTSASTTGRGFFKSIGDTGAVLFSAIYGSASTGTIFGASLTRAAAIVTTSDTAVHPTSLLVGTYTGIPLIFGTANAERMRIDQYGDISMTGGLSIQKQVTTGTNQSSGQTYITIRNYDAALTDAGDIQSVLRMTGRYWSGSTSQLVESQVYSGHEIGNGNGGSFLGFATQSGGSAVVEAMRIGRSGKLHYNCTDDATSSSAGLVFYPSGDNSYIINAVDLTSSWNHLTFINTNGTVGSISTSGSATAFNTSSDYRLKEDLKEFNGLDKVSNIKVYDFKWKVDENRSYGVLAHELAEVLPQAVNGEKDAKEMQGVDYSKIVPILIKSIQELKAEIEILKNK